MGSSGFEGAIDATEPIDWALSAAFDFLKYSVNIVNMNKKHVKTSYLLLHYGLDYENVRYVEQNCFDAAHVSINDRCLEQDFNIRYFN